MLRACAGMLRPGGRLVTVVIETPRGLTREELRRAAEVGPADVAAEDSLEELVRRAGLETVVVEDWTAELRATTERILEALEVHGEALRRAEGVTEWEEAREGKLLQLEGIDDGLLRRTLVAAVRPGGS